MQHESLRAPEGSVVETRYWHVLDDGRVQCDVCPRACKLHEGQRGLCFVRGAEQGRVKLFSYGRSSGFCIDPIEKKPLNHFLPGTSVLSFGTAGCNLACKFCFAPDTLVATTHGMRRIADLFESCEEKVSRDDGRIGLPASLQVWTRAAKPARVDKVFAHPYSGELLSLKAASCPPILLTPSHQVFAADRSDPDYVRSIAAGGLSRDHYLVVPKRQALDSLAIDAAGTLDTGQTFLVPVLHSERIPYEGLVYNLEVDDPDHSYLAPFLAVSNCQNWDMSKSREMDTLADSATPEDLASAAERLGCSSIAFTYNDPVVFMEYAIDSAQCCRERHVRRAARRVLSLHGCRERRSEGLQRALLLQGLRRLALARPRDARVSETRDASLV
jgi:hypothetical protein